MMMKKTYKKGQFIKVKVTGIQPYGAFVETEDHTEGLIHISEVMNDYVHNLNLLLSVGQIVKAKVLNVSEDGKLNLSLKSGELLFLSGGVFRRQTRRLRFPARIFLALFYTQRSCSCYYYSIEIEPSKTAAYDGAHLDGN